MFSFHHVSISVIDLSKSIDFYSCLGFKEAVIWEGDDGGLKIAHLKLADFFLELFCYKNYAQAPETSKLLETDLPRIGVKHLALKVSSIEKAREFLLAKGFASSLDVKEGRTGIKYFFIRDPNEIFIEIVEDNRNFNL